MSITFGSRPCSEGYRRCRSDRMVSSANNNYSLLWQHQRRHKTHLKWATDLTELLHTKLKDIAWALIFLSPSSIWENQANGYIMYTYIYMRCWTIESKVPYKSYITVPTPSTPLSPSPPTGHNIMRAHIISKIWVCFPFASLYIHTSHTTRVRITHLIHVPTAHKTRTDFRNKTGKTWEMLMAKDFSSAAATAFV